MTVIWSIGLLILIEISVAHRVHKVHNIVLYPDKQSWCKTLEIKQVITYPGCKSQEIYNNVCVGACFSYSIPHTEPSDPGEVIVPYCDSCQPSETTWKHVMLSCDSTDEQFRAKIDDLPAEQRGLMTVTPNELIKRVQIIKNCSCTTCEYMSGKGDTSNDEQLSMEQNEVPDLLNILQQRNESKVAVSPEHTERVKNLMNNKLVALLQNIQEQNSQYDKSQLTELLRIVQEPEDKFTDQMIAEFVDSLSGEHIELDMPKLKEILMKFEQSKLYAKNRKFAQLAAIIKPPNDEINSINQDDNHTIIDNHVPMERLSNESGHHMIGELYGHGHLMKGPHGALVIAPEQMATNGDIITESHHHHGHHHDKKKLSVNPNELKLNHAGTMVSYGHLDESGDIKKAK